MSNIIVQRETEQPRGWLFKIDVTVNQQTYHYQVTLNWADYDLWARGFTPPERTAVAVMRWLLTHQSPEAIRPTFDCARLRRDFPMIDQQLPDHITQS